MKPIETDDYLDLVSVAGELQISYSRLWSRAASGQLPAIRTTSGWRVRRDDLAAIRDYFGSRASRKAASDDVK